MNTQKQDIKIFFLHQVKPCTLYSIIHFAFVTFQPYIFIKTKQYLHHPWQLWKGNIREIHILDQTFCFLAGIQGKQNREDLKEKNYPKKGILHDGY